MDSKPTPREATDAAAKILGYYPTIIASDPKLFAAGLVHLLMAYPLEVVTRAYHPVNGIPTAVDRYELTLAKIRKHLDEWSAERGHRLKIESRRQTQLLPEPPRDPEQDARVEEGFKKLSFRMGGLH